LAEKESMRVSMQVTIDDLEERLRQEKENMGASAKKREQELMD